MRWCEEPEGKWEAQVPHIGCVLGNGVSRRRTRPVRPTAPPPNHDRDRRVRCRGNDELPLPALDGRRQFRAPTPAPAPAPTPRWQSVATYQRMF